MPTQQYVECSEPWEPADATSAYLYLFVADLVPGEEKELPAIGIEDYRTTFRHLTFLAKKQGKKLSLRRSRRHRLVVLCPQTNGAVLPGTPGPVQAAFQI